MTELSRDPVFNAIQNGIKEDISVAFEHERYRAGIILIYSGMDAMSYLDMPNHQTEVTRVDFMKWTESYIRFPCNEQLTGADMYGARCAMLHAYGVVSKMSKAGKCRMVGYCDRSVPEVIYDATVHPDLVMVSSVALKDAFFRGIDGFLVSAFSDSSKSVVVEQRLRTFTMIFPRS